MQIDTRNENGIVIISIGSGSLDAASSKEFKTSIAPVLETAERFIFDLGNLTFVDSSGLGAILSCLKTISPRKGQIKLCNLTKSVRIVFELVNMHKAFDIFNTVEEALKSYE